MLRNVWILKWVCLLIRDRWLLGLQSYKISVTELNIRDLARGIYIKGARKKIRKIRLELLL